MRKVSNVERSVLRALLSAKGYHDLKPFTLNGGEALKACYDKGLNVTAALNDACSDAIWKGDEVRLAALNKAIDAENGIDNAPEWLDVEAELIENDAKGKAMNNEVNVALEALQVALSKGNGVDLDDVARISHEVASKVVENALVDFADNAAIAHRIEIVSPDGAVANVVEGLMHGKQALLTKACGVRNSAGSLKNIALTGPRGSGKSQAARIVAKAYGYDYYQHGTMEYKHDVLGSVHPLDGSFRSTPFVNCYRNGGLVLLDELDRWDANATTALNGALADNEIWLDNGECVKRHPDCVIVCAMNTKGTGPDADYVGANKLDAAFLDRFSLIEWPVDLDLEEAIVNNPDVLVNIRKARAQVARFGIDMEITPRMAIDMADFVRGGFSVAEAAELTYLSRMSDDQKEQVVS